MSKKKTTNIEGRKEAFKYVKKQLKLPFIAESALELYEEAPDSFKEFMRNLFGDKKGSFIIEVIEGKETMQTLECMSSSFEPQYDTNYVNMNIENEDFLSIEITASIMSPYFSSINSIIVDSEAFDIISTSEELSEVLYIKLHDALGQLINDMKKVTSDINLPSYTHDDYECMYDAFAKDGYRHVIHYIIREIMRVTNEMLQNNNGSHNEHNCWQYLGGVNSGNAIFRIDSIKLRVYNTADSEIVLTSDTKDFPIPAGIPVYPVNLAILDTVNIKQTDNEKIVINDYNCFVGDTVVYGTDAAQSTSGNFIRVGRILALANDKIQILNDSGLHSFSLLEFTVDMFVECIPAEVVVITPSTIYAPKHGLVRLMHEQTDFVRDVIKDENESKARLMDSLETSNGDIDFAGSICIIIEDNVVGERIATVESDGTCLTILKCPHIEI